MVAGHQDMLQQWQEQNLQGLRVIWILQRMHLLSGLGEVTDAPSASVTSLIKMEKVTIFTPEGYCAH